MASAATLFFQKSPKDKQRDTGLTPLSSEKNNKMQRESTERRQREAYKSAAPSIWSDSLPIDRRTQISHNAPGGSASALGGDRPVPAEGRPERWAVGEENVRFAIPCAC